MMQIKRLFFAALLALPTISQADAVAALLDQYRQQGAGEFSAERGRTQWQQINQNVEDGSQRSCNDCHGEDLSQVGKHKKTGKRIEPMAPSVNPERFTDMKKIKKWFRRNCKWTLGRLCTPQEKGDLLVFLKTQ